MNILVADDNRSILYLLAAILQEDGHTVTPVLNGADAVARFKEDIFDLVLMDIVMPVMDGYEATKQIKALCGSRFVPVIFLTAASDDASLAKCVDSGGDDFLVKPYNRVILAAKIAAFKRIQDLYNTLERYNKQTEEELALAQHIFEAVINPHSDPVAGVETWQSSMGHFNGDMLTHALSPNGELHVMLGDFTGHGLVAAVGAIPTSDVFYSLTRQGADISTIIGEINRKLRTVLPIGRYCAATLVSINFKKQKISIWNGGLPAVLIIDKRTHHVERVNSSKLPLGIIDSDMLDRNMVHLELDPNKTIMVYTDGLTELRNQNGEMLGMEGLEQVIQRAPVGCNLLAEIKIRLINYMAGKEQDDDISLFSFDVKEALTQGKIA